MPEADCVRSGRLPWSFLPLLLLLTHLGSNLVKITWRLSHTCLLSELLIDALSVIPCEVVLLWFRETM